MKLFLLTSRWVTKNVLWSVLMNSLPRHVCRRGHQCLTSCPLSKPEKYGSVELRCYAPVYIQTVKYLLIEHETYLKFCVIPEKMAIKSKIEFIFCKITKYASLFHLPLRNCCYLIMQYAIILLKFIYNYCKFHKHYNYAKILIFSLLTGSYISKTRPFT